MAEGDETQGASGRESIPGSPAGAPASEEDLPPSTRIDRYQIERRLGAGGMGVVYAARDIHLGRAVALKVVGPRIEVRAGQGRLMREAQAMARLRHPNLATVYDVGVSGGRLFVVMELIDGGTVDDWLKAEPRTWRAILALYLQAARGLAAAHAEGFVHRDFKPENVLFGKDGVARVSDFGVARILGDVEVESATAGDPGRTGVVGTPGYIAPEILRREAVDGRADQFSLCVAMHTSLYGERPFERLEGPGGIAETLGELRPPRAAIGPRWLQRIIARGLSGDPRDRWPTIEALTAAIERRLDRRRRSFVAAGAGVAVLAVAAIALVSRSPSAPPPEWTPAVIARDSKDSPLDMVVSRDGSTLLSYSPTEAFIEPRAGGPRRAVAVPAQASLGLCRLSRTGDRIFCGLEFGGGRAEIWALGTEADQAERRIPSSGALALKPGTLFDVGVDDSILFGDAPFTGVWQAAAGGAVERVATALPGEIFTAALWSPGGNRIALRIRTREGARIQVVTPRTGAVAVISHRLCKNLEWLSETSLACAPRRFQNPVILELLLPAGTGEATERVRYSGPEYHQLTGFSVSADGVLFSTSPNHKHLELVSLDASAKRRRVSSGGITDLAPVGWTSSGLLIFGAGLQGHLRIMALGPDGGVEALRMGPAAEVPLAVFGEAVVFGRFPGGESTIPFFETPFGRKYPDGELFRVLRPGAAIEPLGPTRGFSELLCAGGRAAPCLLAERSGDEVIGVDWDPATGRRGRERARWLATVQASSSALSPDGRTLAQVKRLLRGNELSLLDLETGARRSIPVAGTSLDFPRWLPDGELLAMGSNSDDRGIVRVRGTGKVESVAIVPTRGERSTLAEEFEVSGDGKTAAILMTDLLRTHWWVPRPVER